MGTPTHALILSTPIHVADGGFVIGADQDKVGGDFGEDYADHAQDFLRVMSRPLEGDEHLHYPRAAWGLGVLLHADGSPLDLDGDGIPWAVDTCPDLADPDQADLDGDGIGDACDDDPCGDCTDGDPCTEDGCDPEIGCVFSATECGATCEGAYLAQGVSGAMAAWVDGGLHLVGGTSGGAALTQHLVYDPLVSNAWTTATPLLPGVQRGAAVTVNGKMYVLRGLVGSNATTTGHRWDAPDWTDMGEMTAARSDLAAAAHGDKIYAFGGEDGLANNTWEVFDPEKNTWTYGGLLPAPEFRTAWGAAAYDAEILLVAGRADTAVIPAAITNEVQRFDPADESFALGGGYSEAVEGVAVTGTGAVVVVAGGAPAEGPSSQAVRVFEGSGWLQIGQLPTGVSRAAATMVGTTVFVIGGVAGDAHSAAVTCITLP